MEVLARRDRSAVNYGRIAWVFVGLLFVGLLMPEAARTSIGPWSGILMTLGGGFAIAAFTEGRRWHNQEAVWLGFTAFLGLPLWFAAGLLMMALGLT